MNKVIATKYEDSEKIKEGFTKTFTGLQRCFAIKEVNEQEIKGLFTQLDYLIELHKLYIKKDE